ncbi:hypothetical protein F4777DRAFT_584538 [Nemania sp. FL0916]|nr:hypothetical protein F4777DRAFT_584538 [Nemania sp. FL0916]
MLAVATSNGHLNQPHANALDCEKEERYLEIDFRPDEPQFIRARDDDKIYWCNDYKELSHPNLFVRAAKTRKRLIPDLKQTLIKLSSTKTRRLLNGGKLVYDLEPPESRYELRLTGHVDGAVTDRIVMTGYVWLQCSDRYSIWKIKKRMAELTWLKSNEWAPIHVHLDPIIAAYSPSAYSPSTYSSSTQGDDPPVYDDRSGTHLVGDYQLHIDMAMDKENQSLCGRLCRSRITFQSRVVDESFSRIGGTLLVNNSVDALLTTGHGILNYFVTEILPWAKEAKVGESEDITSDQRSEESDLKEFLAQEDYSYVDSAADRAGVLGSLNTSKVLRWEPLKPFDTITYIAQAKHTNIDSTWDIFVGSFNADYALFTRYGYPPSSQNQPQNNAYTINPRALNPGPETHIPAPGGAVTLTTEDNTDYILLGQQEVIPVRLMSDEVEISVCGLKFTTLKFQASDILAQGISGSWVVHEQKFVGVVVALYEFAPCGLLLPSGTVQRNIMEFGVDIRAISLTPPHLTTTDDNPSSSDVVGGVPAITPTQDNAKKSDPESLRRQRLHTFLNERHSSLNLTGRLVTGVPDDPTRVREDISEASIMLERKSER